MSRRRCNLLHLNRQFPQIFGQFVRTSVETVRLRKVSSRENEAEKLLFTRHVTEETTPNLRKNYHPFPFINISSHFTIFFISCLTSMYQNPLINQISSWKSTPKVMEVDITFCSRNDVLTNKKYTNRLSEAIQVAVKYLRRSFCQN